VFLGQAVVRDAFRGVERGKIYAIVGSAISFSPAIGPLMGGLIDQFLVGRVFSSLDEYGWTCACYNRL